MIRKLNIGSPLSSPFETSKESIPKLFLSRSIKKKRRKRHASLHEKDISSFFYQSVIIMQKPYAREEENQAWV
jgi:hypothetical protein